MFATFAIFIYRHNIILISLIHQSIMVWSYKHHPSSGFFSAFLFAILDLKHHVIWSITNTLQNLSSQIFGLQIRYSEHYALICKNDTFLFFFFIKSISKSKMDILILSILEILKKVLKKICNLHIVTTTYFIILMDHLSEDKWC